MKGELNRTVKIYIDSYDNKIPVGRFHIAAEEDSHPFHGMIQMLLKINHILDRENFPQSFSELRKFQMPTKDFLAQSAQMNQTRGEVATFSLRILFRQNASWQGSVTWIEGNQEEYFRSVLELISLMDGALRQDEAL